MAELTLQQHMQLNGGLWSYNEYFDGFKPTLGGIYVPGASAESEPATHFSALVNQLESFTRRFGSASGMYVHKSDSDDDAEFSVKADVFYYRDILCTYAGETGLGPLSVGASNKIWADLSAAPTVTIAWGANYPSTPHRALGTIAQPASGPWMPSNLTRDLIRHAAPPFRSHRPSIKKRLTFANAGTHLFYTLPADSWWLNIYIKVKTVFNGSSPTLKIGDAGDDDRLLQTGDHSLTATNTAWAFIDTRSYEYAAQTDINFVIGGSGATTGEVLIMAEVA